MDWNANVERPTMIIEKVDRNPYQEGGEAYTARQPRDACPYAEGSDKRSEWLDGWDEAKRFDTDTK